MPNLSFVSPKTGKMLAVALISVLLLLSGAAYAWNARARSNDPDVFWKALEAGMSTRGITCTIEDEYQGRRSVQEVALDLTHKYRSVSRTTIDQAGSRVVTEGINTASHEYIRYIAIRSDQKDASGKPLDFSSVNNVWGKQSVISRKSTLYGQTALGGCIVPLASLQKREARALGDELRKGQIFQTNLAAYELVNAGGKQLRQYDVTVHPAAYINFMKQVASKQGLEDLEEISISEYAAREPERLKFQIDTNARLLRVIKYSGQNRTMLLSDHGKVPNTAEPKDTIPTAQLQKRLQAIR